MNVKTPFWFGRYELIGKLGMGGMGELYLARQRGPEGVFRDVALKVMLPDARNRFPGADRMFLEEMHILIGISHPNVVQLIDCGQERDVLYMVMEYVRGVTLMDLWSQFANLRQAFPPDLVASLLAQACRGLHAAHELCDEKGQPRRLVHRDVSPQNIMCTASGTVKVIDFGIAWAVDRLVETTQTAMLKGKPSYMAPEHLLGQPLTRSADIFAVGVMLHELVAGRHLFKRNDQVTTVAAVLEANVPPLRSLRLDVSPRFDDLVQRALSVDPALRPRSAAAFADELDLVVREAGGRFATMESIARYFLSIGVQLMPQPPEPITGAPWSVQEASHEAQPTNSLDPDPATGSEIAAPPEGSWVEHVVGQRKVVLQSITIDARSTRKFELGANLLPVPLLLSAPSSGSLVVEADTALTPDGKSRMGLYHNADDPPERRRASITIQANARGQLFFVGHRRVRLHPLRCDSAEGDGKRPLKVRLSETSLTIVAQEPAAQFAVVYTMDSDNTIYATCVSVL